MQVFTVRGASLLIIAGIANGCGGSDGNTGPTPNPVTPVLTSVQVTSTSAVLYVKAPGNTATLLVVGKDQNGNSIADLGAITYSTSTGSVATVATDGRVTAVGEGNAEITASVTLRGVTMTGATPIRVNAVTASAAVTAPAFSFEPATVHISAGGAVTWTIAGIHHTVTFDPAAGSPESTGELLNQAVSRVFNTSGSYAYHCDFHNGMTGAIIVH